ncbi:MAG: hypothetical protein EBZ69_07520 [Alphaproteobacteria bacterium]|nr:hypothetical protein [Alphaproteobacteria bacterium]NDG19492.1 hypothetical protein [Betaproteobacteria bacterium]
MKFAIIVGALQAANGRLDPDAFEPYKEKVFGLNGAGWEEVCKEFGKIPPEAMRAFVRMGDGAVHHLVKLKLAGIPGASERLSDMASDTTTSPAITRKLLQMGIVPYYPKIQKGPPMGKYDPNGPPPKY